MGDVRTSRSIIGGEFKAEVLGITTVGAKAAILPRITGQAWIYGQEELRIDSEDPFKEGFAMSDTWGPDIQAILKR